MKALISTRKSASDYSEYCDINGTLMSLLEHPPGRTLSSHPPNILRHLHPGPWTRDTTAKTPEIRGSESGLNWTKRAAACFCFYPLVVTISEHSQWSDSSRNTKPISTKLSGTRNSYFWDFCLARASSSSGTMRQWQRADQRSLPWHALLRYKMTNIFTALKLLGPRLEFGFYWFFWLRLHQVRGEGRRNLIKH